MDREFQHVPISRRYNYPCHQGTCPLQVVDCFKYLGVTLDQSFTMQPLCDQILTSINKAHGKLQGLLRDLKSSRELRSTHHSTLGRASTSPKTLRHLWTSCVLVQATQYLRYIHSPSQLRGIQSAVNRSLQTTMGCDSLPITLHADLGVPPLEYHQVKQHTSYLYRLTTIHEHSLPGSLLAFRIGNLSSLSDSDIETRLVRSSHTIFPAWVHTDPLPTPKYLTRVMPQNREKSYSRFLQTPISHVWRATLQSSKNATECSRLNAYSESTCSAGASTSTCGTRT